MSRRTSLSQQQRSGGVYVKSGASWASRVGIINVDTGAFSLYAEKNGKRTLKNQYNVKNAVVHVVTRPTGQLSLGFTINLKDDTETVLICDTDGAEKYEEWMSWLSSCCTVGDPVESNPENSRLVGSHSNSFSSPNTSETSSTKATPLSSNPKSTINTEPGSPVPAPKPIVADIAAAAGSPWRQVEVRESIIPKPNPDSSTEVLDAPATLSMAVAADSSTTAAVTPQKDQAVVPPQQAASASAGAAETEPVTIQKPELVPESERPQATAKQSAVASKFQSEFLDMINKVNQDTVGGKRAPSSMPATSARLPTPTPTGDEESTAAMAPVLPAGRNSATSSEATEAVQHAEKDDLSDLLQQMTVTPLARSSSFLLTSPNVPDLTKPQPFSPAAAGRSLSPSVPDTTMGLPTLIENSDSEQTADANSVGSTSSATSEIRRRISAMNAAASKSRTTGSSMDSIFEAIKVSAAAAAAADEKAETATKGEIGAETSRVMAVASPVPLPDTMVGNAAEKKAAAVETDTSGSSAKGKPAVGGRNKAFLNNLSALLSGSRSTTPVSSGDMEDEDGDNISVTAPERLTFLLPPPSALPTAATSSVATKVPFSASAFTDESENTSAASVPITTAASTATTATANLLPPIPPSNYSSPPRANSSGGSNSTAIDGVEVTVPVINNSGEASEAVFFFKAPPRAPPAAPMPSPAPSVKPPVMTLQPPQIKIQVTKVFNPAHRLARRIQMWDMSCGYSIETRDDVKQFVGELRRTKDPVLISLSYAEDDTFDDWIRVCTIVRERESEIIVSSTKDGSVVFAEHFVAELEVAVATLGGGAPLVVKVLMSEFDSAKEIAAKIAISILSSNVDVAIKESQIEGEVQQLLSQKGNPFHKTLELIQREMMFAEDFTIHQEEVVEKLKRENTLLRAKLTKSQQQQKSGTFYNTETSLTAADDIADDQAADKEGEGPMSKEQWRSWTDEKHRLIRAHNAEKAELINELRALRMAMNPNADHTFSALRRTEEGKQRLEDEVIKAQMTIDRLQEHITHVQDQLENVAHEKTMMEAYYTDQLRELTGRPQLHSSLGAAVSTSSGEFKATASSSGSGGFNGRSGSPRRSGFSSSGAMIGELVSSNKDMSSPNNRYSTDYHTIAFAPVTAIPAKNTSHPLRQALRSEHTSSVTSSKELRAGAFRYGPRAQPMGSIAPNPQYSGQYGSLAAGPSGTRSKSPSVLDNDRLLTTTDSFKNKMRMSAPQRTGHGWK